jgi:uncharacterized membrane protein
MSTLAQSTQVADQADAERVDASDAVDISKITPHTRTDARATAEASLDDEAITILRERRVSGEIDGENYRNHRDLIRDTPISDSAVMRLRMRLARGEITPQQFLEILDDLAA